MERVMVEAVKLKDKDAARAEVERLVEERAKGGSNKLDEALAIARVWELEEAKIKKLFKEADEAAAEVWVEEAEAFFKNPGAQPRVEDEAKVEEPEPEPEPEAEPELEIEVELEEEAEGEATYAEDDVNPANDIRRKLWRMQGALEWINSDAWWVEEVGAALWWMSNGNRAAGCEVFVRWAGEEVRGKWQRGFKVRKGGVERIYTEAQKNGWRYPIANNLNKLDEMAVRVEAALVRVGAEIYQLGNRLVRPVKGEADATKGRKTRIAVLVPIEGAYLKDELTRWVDFFRWKKDEREGSGPHGDLVSAMLSRYGKWTFSAVTGIITSPTLRRDGSLLAKEGWDPESGLLVVGPLPVMPKIGTTREDAERAVRTLDGLLDGFPWVDGPSRSVGLSGMITPVVRPSLGCVPMHSSTAPAPGTGKSYLWDIVAVIAIGDMMPIIAVGPNVEEMDKRIDAQVIEGVGLWSMDNVTIPLGGGGMCQVIERPMYKPRVLGKSEMRERRNNWSIFATGNNLRFKDDVTRRVLRAGLDAKMERPELRRFKDNPLERAIADRGEYLWAALTVVKAYQAAGRPGRLPWIGETFGEWSDNVRSALVWLGYDDPVLSMEAVRDSDPSRIARRAMFQAMFNAYGEEAKTAAEMIADAKNGAIKRSKDLMDRPMKDGAAENLKAALVGYVGERLDAKYLGNKLFTDKGAITDDLTLCSDYDTHNKVNAWKVKRL
jgi:hypothetical protein